MRHRRVQKIAIHFCCGLIACLLVTIAVPALSNPPTNSEAITPASLIEQGHQQLRQGQAQNALEIWKRAEAAYQTMGDQLGVIGSQLNQAQALQVLGFYGSAQKLLIQLQEQLHQQPPSLVKAQVGRSLGVVWQVSGDWEKSRQVLEESLAIAQQLNEDNEVAAILFSLGNSARDSRDPTQASNYYQQAAQTGNNPQIHLEAQLNRVSLDMELGNLPPDPILVSSLEQQLTQLPPSRNSIYAAINFAHSLQKLASLADPGYRTTAAQILARARLQAKNLGDPKGQALVLIELGDLYCQSKQFQQALRLTEIALQLAQSHNLPDTAARAAWQQGKILEATKDIPGAIAAYQFAFNNLESLRSDLVATHTDIQFSFNQVREPIYRQYAALLLGSNKSKNLTQARKVIEALQLAELDNFFREACLDKKPTKLEEIDQQAAVIYTVTLPDRLEVILSLPGGKTRHYATIMPQKDLEATFKTMRQALHPAFNNQERLRLYQQGYDWLIRPAQEELERLNIQTLVFVLDSYLSNIPMSALHDGKQYLVEKYSLALSQGLQLLNPQALKSSSIKAITAGLSQPRKGFNALPEVESELQQISQEIPTKTLLNQEFTSQSLQKIIDSVPFPVVHLATHAQFSSRADQTFILTWNQPIKVKDLDQILSNRGQSSQPIELLVLSACQTAQGDSRAILGLAGVALRSGARSTLATLWSVKDKSTAELMTVFYQQLAKPGVNKSQALRNAQLALLQGDYPHPVFWSPFVLVGNWL